MKKIVIALILLIYSTAIQAQEELKWHSNLNDAIKVAQAEQKPVFLFFTGSDWCGWCIRLQKEVFKTPEFTAWAKENVVLVDVDFPKRTPQSDEIKKQNSDLQQAFQVRGYPTVWLVKAALKDGKTNFEQLGSTGYLAGGPNTWLTTANQIIEKFVADPKPVAEKKAKKQKAKV